MTKSDNLFAENAPVIRTDHQTAVSPADVLTAPGKPGLSPAVVLTRTDSQIREAMSLDKSK